jgi:hypothetical protein
MYFFKLSHYRHFRIAESNRRDACGSMPAVKHLAIVWALFRFYLRLAPHDWYRRPPFLPIPPRKYIQWRLRTAYGKERPAWSQVFHDAWQFGDWLRKFPNGK